MSLLLGLAALAAQAAGPEADSYRAIGATPLWNVRIGGGRMTFEMPGRDIVGVATPARSQTELGHVWHTDELAVSIEYASCVDGLTRRVYAERVMVHVGRDHFEGCGGHLLSRGGPISYDAAGGEPFWWLDIADGRLTFQSDERVIIVPLPAARSTRDGRIRTYEAQGISVAIRRRDCELEDERTYADIVTVTAGGRTVTGCGGRVVREAPE